MPVVARAEAILGPLVDARIPPVTFDCVAAEAVSAAARRLRERGRAGEVLTLLARMSEHVLPESLTWILPDAPVFYAGVLVLMRDSSGVSNVDDVLIALACRERGIPSIAGFDADFDEVGWVVSIAGPEDVPAGRLGTWRTLPLSLVFPREGPTRASASIRRNSSVAVWT